MPGYMNILKITRKVEKRRENDTISIDDVNSYRRLHICYRFTEGVLGMSEELVGNINQEYLHWTRTILQRVPGPEGPL